MLRIAWDILGCDGNVLVECMLGEMLKSRCVVSRGDIRYQNKQIL